MKQTLDRLEASYVIQPNMFDDLRRLGREQAYQALPAATRRAQERARAEAIAKATKRPAPKEPCPPPAPPQRWY